MQTTLLIRLNYFIVLLFIVFGTSEKIVAQLIRIDTAMKTVRNPRNEPYETQLQRAWSLYKNKQNDKALNAIDSVIKSPGAINDSRVWGLRAYIYYNKYELTDKLVLFSKLRDTVLSFLAKSNSLNPELKNLNYNKTVIQRLANDYFSIARRLIVDSTNFSKSEFAYSLCKKLSYLADTNFKNRSKDYYYYTSGLSLAQERIYKKWTKTNQADTNDYIFLNTLLIHMDSIGSIELIETGNENLLEFAKANRQVLTVNYNSIEKQKFQKESIDKQIQLALLNSRSIISQMALEKQKSDIALLNSNAEFSKLQVEKQQRGIEMLKKEKALQTALVEKQEIEAKKREEEIEQQRFIRNISFVGIAMLFLIVFLIYRSLNLNKKQNKIILAQKSEVESQKHLVEEKHREITDSINYAERIQRSFMATKEILDENLKDYFVFFQPKDVVSGDFYWGSKLSNGNFALATADSTGHGVPGAIMSLLNIASLEKSVEKEVEPAEILNSTRKIIIERLKKDGSAEGGKDGMDCSLVSFDFEKKTLLYSAAHNPVWIVRQVISSSDKGAYREMINENSSRYEQSFTRTDSAFELIELEPDKMPVGKHDHDARSFSQKSFDLIQGDVIYTLTDGYPDQFGGAKGKKFMYKKLKELFISIASKSMEEQKEILATTFSDWKGDSEQVDDVCVIGVRV